MVNFKKIREQLGLSQMQVAVKAGVSLGTIAGLEQGRIDVKAMQSRTRAGLATAYGVDPVTGEPVPAQEPQPASSQVGG